jgi:hypothetical protein
VVIFSIEVRQFPSTSTNTITSALIFVPFLKNRHSCMNFDVHLSVASEE